MRNNVIFTGVAFIICAIVCLADEPNAPKPATKAALKAVPAIDERAAVQGTAGRQTLEEVEVRQTATSFIKAFDAANAKSVAAHFAPNAEYVDGQGNVYQGRPAIEAWFTTHFQENVGLTLQLKIDSIRFINPALAIEDGTTSVTQPSGTSTAETRYTAIHVKSDGKWLTASVRDQTPKNRRLHRSHLQQLDWLIGHWVDEGPDAVVSFSCEAVEKGNFLLRKFTLQVAGEELVNGTQRIGWDSVTGKLRAWSFDTEGGYSEGTWHRDGDAWLLKSIGATADGQSASSTTIYRKVNGHTMTWQVVDHEIGGEAQSNSEVVTIVRQAPIPFKSLAGDKK